MTMDSADDSKVDVEVSDLHSEMIRIALLRLNTLHDHMFSVHDVEFFIPMRNQDVIKAEYDSIKERVEIHMPGFHVLYCNEARSHCLVPVKQGGDKHANH